jgi:hypothetical protein
LAWYPLLICVAVLLQPFTRYAIHPLEAGRVAVVVVLVGLAAVVTGRMIAGPHRGAAIAALALMGLGSAASLGQAVVFAAGIALVLVEAVLIEQGTLKVRIPWARVSEAAATVLVVLIVLLGIRAASLRAGLPGIPAIAASAVARAATADRPDILMVLLDGHGRRDVLERDYGYDMQPLRGTLTRLGFVEAPDSRANHTNTRFSLSVMLNGRPMAELGQDMTDEVDEAIPAAALSAATDLALLRSTGYRIVTLTSGYAEVRVGEPGEVVDVGPWNELEQTVLRSTLVGRVVDPDRAAQAAGQRERVRRELDYLVDLAREPASAAPLFAFVHVPAPHPPMVFEADCSARPLDELTDHVAGEALAPGGDRAIAAQRDQTTCVDSLVSGALGNVVAARPNAVVILFSDHGPDELLDWERPDAHGMDDRFGNLFWARTPGQAGLFPSDVTLVNVLPLLLNRYLGSSLPVHADDLFFGPSDADHHYVPYRPPPGDGPDRPAIGCACNQSEPAVLCSKTCPRPP